MVFIQAVLRQPGKVHEVCQLIMQQSMVASALILGGNLKISDQNNWGGGGGGPGAKN